MAFAVDRGAYETVSLDGLGFIVLGFTPEEMGKGNWSVGVIADERASAEQCDAITAIADNTGHPAADRFALARASRSHVQALGLAWRMTQPSETMDSTRHFPGAAPGSSNQPRATTLESALGLGFLISRWRGGSVSTARASAV